MTITEAEVLAAMGRGSDPVTAPEIAETLAIHRGDRQPASYYRYIVKRRLDRMVDAGTVIRYERTGPNGAHCYVRSGT